MYHSSSLIGTVNILRDNLLKQSVMFQIDAYCEYMLRCKDISHPIQKFSKDTFKAIAKHSTDISDVLKNKVFECGGMEYVYQLIVWL